MAARAMWKGIIRFGEVRVPVKMYAAIQDRDIHFRLLHRKDQEPVKQVMYNPDTESVVSAEEVERAFINENGNLVILQREELEALKPEPSRDIEVFRFFRTGAVDHRWYERPYYLGPDGSGSDYAALAKAMADGGFEGLARWTMRNREYMGVLRLHAGYPMLMSLRSDEEVIAVEDLEAPKGKPLDERELAMARQLIGMLEAPFEPESYHDEYRERVQEMLAARQAGGKVKLLKPRKAKAAPDIARALEASLKQMQRQA
ncbi:MAG TPA: Ku protein [Gammaproteobacteria bacterium]|nr:Ku protein [Gammaproteobacteria bacterium]